eukprot:CAMPEP_0202112954 /NCGR_PEP_ID=MMETSP0965-20130614/32787_1 /ASSEMBLY_ACC=CAM_ASM_000507 /TAXON_ID=4773 /ORGANISM="Schizochytrium aggregatum, Strain ATCC28209" /LENGTH=83 /DNA_ID=CAMNT_0048682537 /DNA_START=220 /DNA_END=471 /DNA_ORIENTATION=+
MPLSSIVLPARLAVAKVIHGLSQAGPAHRTESGLAIPTCDIVVELGGILTAGRTFGKIQARVVAHASDIGNCVSLRSTPSLSE